MGARSGPPAIILSLPATTRHQADLRLCGGHQSRLLGLLQSLPLRKDLVHTGGASDRVRSASFGPRGDRVMTAAARVSPKDASY